MAPELLLNFFESKIRRQGQRMEQRYTQQRSDAVAEFERHPLRKSREEKSRQDAHLVRPPTTEELKAMPDDEYWNNILGGRDMAEMRQLDYEK